MEVQIEMLETVKKNLEKNGFTVSCFATAKEAADYLNKKIDGKTVGFGGSVTLDEMGVYGMLSSHNKVSWHRYVPDGMKAGEVIANANSAQIYLSSVNGLAKTGEIINIDGVCNRVSSMLYGHEKVYLVVGLNKLADDYDSALWRARNVAAPKNARRLGKKTPCAEKADKCYDCKSPDRICRALSVLWSKPMGSDVEIVLIEEELGY